MARDASSKQLYCDYKEMEELLAALSGTRFLSLEIQSAACDKDITAAKVVIRIYQIYLLSSFMLIRQNEQLLNFKVGGN